MFGPVDVIILAREELRSEVEEIATREIPDPEARRPSAGAVELTIQHERRTRDSTRLSNEY